jgi:hypothetical protein
MGLLLAWRRAWRRRSKGDSERAKTKAVPNLPRQGTYSFTMWVPVPRQPTALHSCRSTLASLGSHVPTNVRTEVVVASKRGLPNIPRVLRPICSVRPG